MALEPRDARNKRRRDARAKAKAETVAPAKTKAETVAPAKTKAETVAPAKTAPRARRYASRDWTPDTPAKWQERGADGCLSDRPRRGPDGRLIGW